nr:SDR family oxidoreductase [Polynucleobacter sp. AM-26B4]
MRVLITGGYGYIGGSLAKHLFHSGYEIILGSRNLHPAPNWLPEARNVLIDWFDSSSLENACENVDVIIHASGMNARDSEKNPTKALEVNGLLTGKLIEAAKSKKVKRFIYLSTAHVYLSPLLGNISEDVCPRNLHPYASSHLAGENLLLADNQLTGIVLRLSNSFGAPVKKDTDCWTLVINDLCRQAVEKKNITIRSDTSQLRDFIALSDVTLAIEHFINLPLKNNIDNVFNLGGNLVLNLREVSELVATRCSVIFGYKPGIKYTDQSKEFSRCFLNYQVQKLLSTGFNLKNPIEKEIDDLLLYCKKNFSLTL